MKTGQAACLFLQARPHSLTIIYVLPGNLGPWTHVYLLSALSSHHPHGVKASGEKVDCFPPPPEVVWEFEGI